MTIALYIILGLVAGVFSGFVGLGGGTIIVPALIYFAGLTQHQAQGTTLAILVPPIGLLAAYTYYKAGYVDISIAACVCIGFFLGGLLGAKVAVVLPPDILRRIFGIGLLLIALHIIFVK